MARTLFRAFSSIPKPKVLVAMSGGVDSSVAAFLLSKNPNFDLEGVFMTNWDAMEEMGTKSCHSSIENDYQDMKSVCTFLNIPHRRVDFIQSYWHRVFTPWLREMEQGHTPNPDAMCNREIKFNAFRAYAKECGADCMATGHYAKIVKRDSTSLLYAAVDENKDQSYFLSTVRSQHFENVLFPLSEHTKTQVRDIAMEAKIPTATKKDSMGICFIGKRNFRNFIHEYLPNVQGRFICLETGENIGAHGGYASYTNGQNAKLAGKSEKWFIAKKDDTTSNIFVVKGTRHPALYSDYLLVDEFNWIDLPNQLVNGDSMECHYRVRHRQPLGKCTVRIENQIVKVQLHVPHRAVAKKQIATLYGEDGQCFGGGAIMEIGPSYFDMGKSISSDVPDWSVY